MGKIFGFKKNERLKTRKNFSDLFKKGRRYSETLFTVYFKAAEQQEVVSRIGIVTSRKTGSAVWRNYLRRIIRESFRKIKQRLKIKGDLVVIFKPAAKEAVGKEIERRFVELLEKARLL